MSDVQRELKHVTKMDNNWGSDHMYNQEHKGKWSQCCEEIANTALPKGYASSPVHAACNALGRGIRSDL